MAIGKSGENLKIDRLNIKIGDFLLIEKGKIVENYNEKIVKEYMEWDSIVIDIEINMGARIHSLYM